MREQLRSYEEAESGGSDASSEASEESHKSKKYARLLELEEEAEELRRNLDEKHENLKGSLINFSGAVVRAQQTEDLKWSKNVEDICTFSGCDLLFSLSEHFH